MCLCPYVGLKVVSGPYCGLAECRLVLSGTLVLVGIPFGCSSESYKTGIGALSQLTGGEFAAVVKQGDNFCVAVPRGHTVLVPSGYVVLTLTCEVVTGLRWGLFPTFDGGHRRVVQIATAMLDGNPTLRTTGRYKPWVAYVLADERARE